MNEKFKNAGKPRRGPWTLLACLLLGVVSAGCGSVSKPAADVPNSPQERLDQTIAAVKELGGKIETDETGAPQAAVAVDLSYSMVTDAELQSLSQIATLRRLNLSRTRVTDAALEHLRRMPELQELNLDYTHCTDAALVHLKGSPLRILNLGNTRVTAAGLAHLRGLPQLQELKLTNTLIDLLLPGADDGRARHRAGNLGDDAGARDVGATAAASYRARRCCAPGPAAALCAGRKALAAPPRRAEAAAASPVHRCARQPDLKFKIGCILCSIEPLKLAKYINAEGFKIHW